MGSLEDLTVSLGWDLHDVYTELERVTKDLDLVTFEIFNECGDDVYLSDDYCIGATRFTFISSGVVDFTADDLTEDEVEQLKVAAPRLGVSVSKFNVIAGVQVN